MINANRTMFDISSELRFALPLWQYIATPKWRRLIKAEDVYYSGANELIQEAFGRMEQSSNEANMLFMNYLVNQANKQHISMEDTAPMFIYNLYCIGSTQRAQTKLHDELTRLTDNGRNFSPEKLRSAPYLNACIKETFRLFPIGTEVSRVTQRDLVLSGYHVPEGTAVDINMASYLKSERHFSPEPLEFSPERWVRNHASYVGRSVHPFALLPFGHGTRMCAGRRFAEQDLRVSIARMILAFRIEYVDDKPLEQEMHSLLLPKGDCVFRFVPRN